MSYKLFTKYNSKKKTSFEIIYLVSICIFILLVHIFNFENSFVNWISFTLFIIIMLLIPLSIIYNIFSFFRFEKLNGELNQTLDFSKEGIIINNHLYSINSIKKIEINTFDYKGRSINHRRAFKAKKSNGTRNELKITFNDNTLKHIYFQQLYKNQIHIEKFILIEYCNLEKINYLNLLDILK